VTTGILVDTHVLLWHLTDDPRLGPVPTDAIEEHGFDVFVSAASIWELAIKSALGKLQIPDDLPGNVVQNGFRLLDVTPEHAWATRSLPMHHRDPFDRMLVAQAKVEGLLLLSADPALSAYDVSLAWD
jgi:PIN domain nuclease of toxin-antitoxin system